MQTTCPLWLLCWWRKFVSSSSLQSVVPTTAASHSLQNLCKLLNILIKMPNMFASDCTFSWFVAWKYKNRLCLRLGTIDSIISWFSLSIDDDNFVHYLPFIKFTAVVGHWDLDGHSTNKLILLDFNIEWVPAWSGPVTGPRGQSFKRRFAKISQSQRGPALTRDFSWLKALLAQKTLCTAGINPW